MSAHTTGHPHPATATPARGRGGRAPVIPPDPATAHSPIPAATRRRRLAQRVGRVGVLLIPVYAVLVAVAPRSTAAFSTDPTTYARYLATLRYRPSELVATFGLGLCCVLSAAFLAMLTLRGAGRWLGVTGAALVLIGTGVLLVVVGGVVIRAERLRTALFGLRWARLDIDAHATSTAAAVVVIGAAAGLTVGWMLLGAALLATPGANTGDGVLLMASAPLIYLGGMVLRTLPAMGSFILLAAALGIVLTGGRMVGAADAAARGSRRRRTPPPEPVMPAILVPDSPESAPRRRRGRE